VLSFGDGCTCSEVHRIVRGVTNCSDSCGFKKHANFPNCTTVGPTHAWALGGGGGAPPGVKIRGGEKGGKNKN